MTASHRLGAVTSAVGQSRRAHSVSFGLGSAGRAGSGKLVITAVSDSTIRGFFRLEATGFVASEPEREDRTVSAGGAFAATGR